MNYFDTIRKHYQKIWNGHGITERWRQGRMHSVNQNFEVLKFPPNNSRQMWAYATVGMSLQEDENPIELHIFSANEDNGLVELLTVIAYYHFTERKLYLEHTINLGRPWQGKSNCEYGFISLPYLDGPEFESLKIKSKVVKFLWLIPVSKAEVEYKKEFGPEALEERFEEKGLDYINPDRESTV